ncbi:glycosyltransferase family 4 protein [Caldisericum sp.]|jgi:glycosyltransferase involved in cell wall biosynthesis|uniref:glycosyltransferase family 4 protein n=1 Tax=Caldisericum sp. TaxID=2499687 RepID=UPI003D0EAC27
MKVCFFAGVKDKSLLTLMQWYANDILILRDLGFDVTIATKWSEIPWNADLYFAWWPTKGILPLIKSKLSHKPVIVVAGGTEVVHSYNLEYNFTNSGLLKKKTIIFVLNNATKVLAISKAAEKEIKALVPKANIETVYLSVDTETFSPVAGAKKDIIFTISHLNKENIYRKRILSIIRSARQIVDKFPELKFVIAGRKLDGFEQVVDEVKRLSLSNNFIFPGKISNDEKIEYFRRSLIYLQPTLHEGFGLAIAEAMSCGVPVVTSKVGAVEEVVGNCGIYVDSNNENEISNAVISLLINPELRGEMGKCARERIVENFSYEIRKKRIETIIDGVIALHYGGKK